jgi:Spy/CpxP family protein refolding chaperone
MRRFEVKCGAALIVLLAGVVPVLGQGFAWWRADQFQKEIGLTRDQSNRIDGVFQSALPKLHQAKDDLDRQQAELSRLIEADTDEFQVSRQVDRVEATRAILNKARTMMLVHMRQVLTPEQRVLFKTALDKWDRDHHLPNPNNAPSPPGRRE